MHSYAIGDIHGNLDKLEAAHALIARDQAVQGAGPIVHVGDLVDRGPDSKGVIEYLRRGMASGENWVVLKGNHDRLCSLFLADPRARDPGLRTDMSWLHPRIGGAETLASYGVKNAMDRPIAPVFADAQAAVPEAHQTFLAALPTQFQRGATVFVHAGIRPDVSMAAQVENDLVWIREPFLSDPRDHGALIVHGHTVVDAVTHYGNRLNIDSGAAYGGPLSAVVIEGRQAWLLTPEGRKPVLTTTL